MKIILKTLSASLLSLLLLINGCKEDEHPVRTYIVQGHVQKGAYILGTPITISELTQSLEQTGKTFNTEIKDNTGSFDIPEVTLTSNFVHLSADGFYYNEVSGEVSDAPLTLSALSDLSDRTTVNVNVLTHLEKLRVQYLVAEGETFADAKQIAQVEVLRLFGFSAQNIGSSETLDITQIDDGGAILLAVSLILQGDRTVGELSEQLAIIANDIEDDGILDNDGVMPWLRYSAIVLPTDIRQKLEKRYQEIGLTAGVPDFEQYVQTFLEFRGVAPYSGIYPAENVGLSSATLRGVIVPGSLSTTVTFEYGPTTDYGNSIAALESPVKSNGGNQVSAELTGLPPATTFHYRVRSENVKGVGYSDDQVFRTLGDVPLITPALAVTDLTQATLSASVAPNLLNTTVTFEYGLTTAYGSNSSASTVEGSNGATAVKVDQILTGLTTGKTYHYRVKAENQVGVVFSNDQTFVAFHSIGTSFQGGLLGYVLLPGDLGYDENTPHGLIVAASNMPNPNPSSFDNHVWHTNITVPVTGTNSAIGSGRSNTEKIVAFFGAGNYAANNCSNFVLNGYDDWFLPSIDELKALMPHRAVLNMPNGTFWSSTEYSKEDAWMLHVSDTRRDWKTYSSRVRPMRYF